MSSMTKDIESQRHQHYHQHYELLVQLLHREIESLFSRFNFFLIVTAFLVAAFVTIVVNDEADWTLNLLRHAIAAVGFYMALFFTVTNYLNARFMTELQNWLEDGNEIIGIIPYRLVYQIKDRAWKSANLLSDIKSILYDPIEYKGTYAPHTWILPLLFTLFWLIVWLTVVPFRFPHQGMQIWVPIIFGVILPLLYYAYTNIKRKVDILGYFIILATIFFLISFIVMLLWGVIAPDFGIEKIDYPRAMLITITFGSR